MIHAKAPIASPARARVQRALCKCEFRKYQIFAWSGWTGYTIVNPTIQSGRSAGPIAGAWAALNFIGEDGSLRLAKITQDASAKMCAAITAMEPPDLLDAMESMFTGGTGGMPDEMRPINTLMDAMPFEARDRILKEYINRLYAKPAGAATDT